MGTNAKTTFMRLLVNFYSKYPRRRGFVLGQRYVLDFRRPAFQILAGIQIDAWTEVERAELNLVIIAAV
jgi:hypothetical protein